MAEAAHASSPILSIAIPTRERARYLRGAIKTALACTDPDIEVIVSDNASADNTREVVGTFSDPRLVYVNTGRRVPMKDNFQLALSRCTGRYLIFIGDDDGVLPVGIEHLLHVLRRETPDAVNWQMPTYRWPQDDAGGNGGDLLLKPRDLRGGMRKVDLPALIADFAAGRVRGYRNAVNLYHGCVARAVIDRVTARTGSYFNVAWPDADSAIANLFEARSFLMFLRPCSLGGTSPASNGASMHVQERLASGGPNPMATFVQENTSQGAKVALESRLRSLQAITYLTLLDTIERMQLQCPRIETQTWHGAIEAEIAKLPEPARSEQADMTDAGLARFGEAPLTRRWPGAGAKKSRDDAPLAMHRFLPNRLNIASSPGLCDDVASAATVADRIIGEASETERAGLGLAVAWGSALLRAASAVSRH